MKQFDPRQPLQPGITLVEASAGTGKTYTLAALYVRLVLGHDPDNGFGTPLLQIGRLGIPTASNRVTVSLERLSSPR